MLKNTLVFTFAVLIGTTAFTQDYRSLIYEKKKQFLSGKINLNDSQQKEFWILYEEYYQKKKDLRIELSQNKLDLRKSNITEKEVQEIVQKDFSLKEKFVILEKEYLTKYSKILSTEQLVSLLNAEEDFHKIMMERIKEDKHATNSSTDDNN